MAAEMVRATLTGGKVDGQKFEQDVNVPDPGFAASQIGLDVTWALMDAYPTVMPPVDPDKLGAASPFQRQLTVRLPDGQTLKFNWQDYLKWIQMLPIWLDILARLQAGLPPGEAIASPIVPVPINGRVHDVWLTVRGRGAASAAPGTEKNSAKPDADNR